MASEFVGICPTVSTTSMYGHVYYRLLRYKEDISPEQKECLLELLRKHDHHQVCVWGGNVTIYCTCMCSITGSVVIGMHVGMYTQAYYYYY